MQSPIQVGILFANRISFFLHGDFFLKGWSNSISGECTLESGSNGSYLFTVNGKIDQVVLPLVLTPLDASACFFELKDVTIGINFHWERKENQRFTGSLKIIDEGRHLTAINVLPLDDYLESVISSEMSANASPAFLKAHAVISRSWLLAQIEKAGRLRTEKAPELGTRGGNAAQPVQSANGIEPGEENVKEHIRWYDREDHAHFDVCADDHCQRYQGITRATSQEVARAVGETFGEVLQYAGKLCDTRYSKCCGGISELFENVWEDASHPYLTRVIDHASPPVQHLADLSMEENARRWITSSPEAFCNTTDKAALMQVLNDYDLETPDFYRWQVDISQKEIQKLLKEKLGIELGDILALTPMERGVSGRIIRLRIEGSQGSIIIGKELEIRRAFSKTHLYSSAFVVDSKDKQEGVPQNFHFKGAGWGHGVGLCQIGAAVMGARNYGYKEILAHYFPGAELKKLY